MRAVISVVGKDRTGILAYVSNVCYEHGMNIEDVTQKVMDEFFVMIMIVTVPDENHENFVNLVNEIEAAGQKHALSLHVMHEAIFNAMHTI